MLPETILNKKAHLITYGCQMNDQDSLQMRGLLAKVGYASTEVATEADLILLVTCSIREKAVHKVYSELGRVKLLLEDNPDLIVGVAGCVAQQEKGNLFKRYPYLDLVFGPDAIKELPQMVSEVERTKKIGFKPKLLKTDFDQRVDFEFVNLITDGEENRMKAFVNIQKGCDNVCSFCIVPRVRGGEVSRPSSDIIREVKELVDLGVKEITLLGQNVNSYGIKDSQEISFARLLKTIATTTGIERLRFTTSHPKDVGDDLISLFAELPNLCPHFHLPVQSGSNRVLEAMRRQYTREHYLSIVEKLRKARPELAFTTDVIVGFPGEEAADFEATMELINEVGFDQVFGFTYSTRPGTTANRLDDQLPEIEKKKRLEILFARQKQISQTVNNKLVGTKCELLVEKSADFGLSWMGRTGSNKIVHFKEVDANKEWIGKYALVEIKKAQPNSLLGEVINV